MSEIIYLKSVDSTNNYLKAHLGEFPDGTAVTAEEQTSGRGRHGHEWSGSAGMLPLSIVYENPPEVETLTARLGLAVCDAVEKMYRDPPKCGIKWANDIIIAYHKVCGILCESVMFRDKKFVICGIGVNISQTEEYFSEAGLPHAGSLLTLTGKAPERGALLSEIVARARIRADMPFAECIEEYRSRLVNLGRQVKLISPKGIGSAVAVDVAENGSLICRDDSGDFQINSGEVTVRGENGYI